MSNITVLLLAGGKSTRFWPLSHKMKISFLGRTFLEHQIDMLHNAGFKNIILVGTEEISTTISGQNVKTIVQVGEGQGAAIISAKKYLNKSPILIVNASDLVSSTLYQKIKANEIKQNILVGYKTSRYFPGGYLKLEGNRVINVYEKPGKGNEPSNFVKLVCDYFNNGRNLLDALLRVKSISLTQYEDAISFMMKQGEIFEMIKYEDIWLPQKYPWNVLTLMDHFLSQIKGKQISKSAQIHKSASISGPVMIEDNVRVMEYAKLVGPVYIGAGTIIGNHTLVRSSIIGEQSVVGFSSDITRSFIGNNSWFHSNYIGDSVISDNVGLGAGAVLANLRLDEGEIYSTVKGERIGSNRVKLGAIIGEGARIGVGSQIMPGVKIGKNSVVGAGVILQQDLLDNKRCYIRQSHTIEDNKLTTITDRERFRKKI